MKSANASYEELGGETAKAGSYHITTVNGSVYEILVPTGDGVSTMERMVNRFPRDPESGIETQSLFGDGNKIELMGWHAQRGNAGARFMFFDPQARISLAPEDYRGTSRWTSAVVSIEKVA